MAHRAIRTGILNPRHVGALPRHSTIDTVFTFVHQVETWLAGGKYVVAVMNDVNGAFYAVLHGWFTLRLRRQGWDDAAVQWWTSFASDRKARVLFRDACPEEYSPLDPIGLPQGSLASSIGYAFYTAEMHSLPGDRWGYADDPCLAAAHLEDAVRLATDMTRQQLRWCHENGVELDFGKAEAQLYCRRASPTFPTIAIPEYGCPVSVPSKQDPSTGNRIPTSVKSLGVYLDRKLLFKEHVQQWAAKGRRVAHQIRGLGGVSFGPPPALLRKTALSCVPPITHYAAEIWWEGETAPRWGRGDVIRGAVCLSPVAHLTSLPALREAWRTMLRAIVPTWKTTPIDALLREAGVPTAREFAERRREDYAARLARLEREHPTVLALTPVTHGTRRYQAPVRASRLLRLADLVGDRSPRPLLIERISRSGVHRFAGSGTVDTDTGLL